MSSNNRQIGENFKYTYLPNEGCISIQPMSTRSNAMWMSVLIMPNRDPRFANTGLTTVCHDSVRELSMN